MKAFPKDVTVQTMKKRHIGVESELGNKGNIQLMEAECSKHGLLNSIGFDGGGREFRTNPIAVHTLKQTRGFAYFQAYYGELKKNTTVLSGGGTHVHISILNSDHENMESNAAAMGITFFKQFQKIAGRNTIWAYRMGYSTLDQLRDELASRKYSGRTYRRYGSMLAPTGLQTLEFRGPKGSNDCDEILAWIEFINNVVVTCNRESVEGIKFKHLIRGKRLKAYVAGLPKSRQFTDKELNQKFNGNNLR